MGGLGFFFVILVLLGIGGWITAAEWLSANIMYILSVITGLVTWFSFRFYSDNANQIAKRGSGVALIIYLLSLDGKDEVSVMTTIMFIAFFILLFLLSVSSGFIGKIFICLTVVFCCYSIAWPIGYRLEREIENSGNIAYVYTGFAHSKAGKFYFKHNTYSSGGDVRFAEEIEFEDGKKIENVIQMTEKEKKDLVREQCAKPGLGATTETDQILSRIIRYYVPITVSDDILFLDSDAEYIYYYIDSDYANKTLGKNIFSFERACFNIYTSFHPDSDLPQFIKAEKQ